MHETDTEYSLICEQYFMWHLSKSYRGLKSYLRLNRCKTRKTYKKIFKFNSIEEEINFVVEKICNLIEKGIDITKIKLLI